MSDLLELADMCAHAARECWRSSRDPDHSWDRPTNLRMAQRMAIWANDLRALASGEKKDG